MLDTRQYMYDFKEAKNVEDAFATLRKHLATVGMDRAVYSLMTDFNSIDLPSGHAILGNYPDDWMQYYIEPEYEDTDPVRKLGMVTCEPFAWDEIEDFKEMPKDEQLILNQAADAKLLDGFGVGIHGPFNEIAGIGFANSAGGVELDFMLKRELHHLAFEFHTAFMWLHAYRTRRITSPLTCRENQIVKWMARGKTAAEIAQILSVDGSISVHTVRFHIKNIYEKLEVKSAAQVVAKGLKDGFLTFAELHI